MAKGHTPPNAHSIKYSSLAWDLAKQHFPLRSDKSLHVVAHAIQIGMKEEARLNNGTIFKPQVSPAQHKLGEITIGQIKHMQHGLADLLCWYAGVKCALDLLTLAKDNYREFDTPPGIDQARKLNIFLLDLITEDAKPKDHKITS